MFYYILISMVSDEKSVKILIIDSLYIRVVHLWKLSVFSLYLWFKPFDCDVASHFLHIYTIKSLESLNFGSFE